MLALSLVAQPAQLRLPSASLTDKAWDDSAWTVAHPDDPMSPIKMDVTKYSKAQKAAGPTALQWHPATNSKSHGAASYTSVCLGAETGSRTSACGIMYSQRQMRDHEMPKHDDKVMIYMPNRESLRGLELEKEEKESSRTITLVPITQDSLPAATRAPSHSPEDATPRSSFAMWLKTHQSRYASNFEREFLPIWPWGLWGPYMAAGFLPAFATAAYAETAKALTPSMEKELQASRKLAQKKHAKTLYLNLKGKRVPFTSAGELERKMFLPFVAAPLFFYPWGFALGAAYFAAPLAGAVPLFKPLSEPVWKDITDTYVAWVKQYWTTYYWWGGLGYWYWFWVVYSVYWQPMIAKYWLGVYKAYWDYWYGIWSKFWIKPVMPPTPFAMPNATLPMPTPMPMPATLTNMTLPVLEQVVQQTH